MIEDVEYALNRLSEALADGDTQWIEDASQEVALAMDEQRDELLWAVSRVSEARLDGDSEWIADAVEELQNILLALGAYVEVNRAPVHDPDDPDAAPEPPSDIPHWLRGAFS
ncbi:MAG: hypothetical protein CMH57_04945 [Myxococcales bacterium]|nr:hypothetical protein [Myxococcales bacterium]